MRRLAPGAKPNLVYVAITFHSYPHIWYFTCI